MFARTNGYTDTYGNSALKCIAPSDRLSGASDRVAVPSDRVSGYRYTPYTMPRWQERSHCGAALDSGFSDIPLKTAWPTPGTSALLPNAVVLHDYSQLLPAIDLHQQQQQMYALHCLQEACDIGTSVIGTHNIPTSGHVSAAKNHHEDHPFYWRRRAAPAEGITRTRDKYRVVYTEKQRDGLESCYEENKFITSQRKTQLSKELDLSERQIKIWFQNRRAKERRDSRRDAKPADKENQPPCTGDDVNEAVAVDYSAHGSNCSDNAAQKPHHVDEAKIVPLQQCRYGTNQVLTSRQLSPFSGIGDSSFSPDSHMKNSFTGNQSISPNTFTAAQYAGYQSSSPEMISSCIQTTRNQPFSADVGNQNSQSAPGSFSTGQCLYQTATQTDTTLGNKLSDVTSALPPVSPSDWSVSSSSGFIPQLDISPLAVNIDFGFAPRL